MDSVRLPVPKELNLRDGNIAENWRRFETSWNFYEIASGYDKAKEKVRVAALLSVIGTEAVEIYETWEWERDADKFRITEVLRKFKEYCIPRSNVLFETYKFNTRLQSEDETIDQYLTALRRLADTCEIADKERRLRDQVVLGMKEESVRARILRSTDHSFSKVVDTIRASEIAERQCQRMKEDKGESNEINKIQHQKSRNPSSSKSPFQKNPATDDNKEFKCRRCGTTHGRRQCPAWGQTCNSCGKPNHFARCCRGKEQQEKAQEVEVDTNTVTIEKKIYTVNGKSKTKTFNVWQRRENVKFEIDTGAEINVLPWVRYKKLTTDHKGEKLNYENVTLVTYGGTKVRSMGYYYLNLKIQGKKVPIKVTVADVPSSPILSRATSEELKLVQFLDCDQITAKIQEVTTKNAGITKEELLTKYADVFDGLGKLEGEYKIIVDESVKPVIHAPRRVPVAIREELKQLLESMETEDIIAKVTQPTKWVSSLMLKREPNKLRICLDPQDLNKAIQREHYPLPTLEEVTTRLTGAKVFSVLDAKRGFWQVALEEDSSYLTTFNTPFGRYRWKRMPFGISSAPEVFQRRMMQFAENLPGVEVVADDFLVVGYGNTQEDAIRNHDRNITRFLEKARENNLKLNGEKLRLKMEEVPFIGHLLTKEGIKVDPRKVKAVKEMPSPTDAASVSRFLGFVNYLAKFLPKLSEMAQPLRKLTKEDVEWAWSKSEQKTFDAIKEAVIRAPVLAYYDIQKEVTIQCDSSQAGIGGALLQEGKPVAFTSRTMTKTEQKYAQIEKEMLAILHCCLKFDQYIYGRPKVTIETDHKPLETIFRKSTESCPRRLQRMLLALQKYSLNVTYKRGKDMFLADTLSRAYLPVEENLKECDILEIKEAQEAAIVQAISAMEDIPNSERRTQEIREATAKDKLLQQIKNYIQEGWPADRKNVTQEIFPYYDCKEELTEETGLHFKGTRVVIPASQRKEVMETLHASHMGIEGTLRRAREYVYWPNMNAQMKDKISRCGICNKFRSAQRKEPLVPHEVPVRPWCHVSADLFEFNRETFLVVVDHYSNWFEYDRISSITSYNVIFSMKSMFARLGIPEKIVSDNGRQFASTEFRQFSRQYGFDHRTSSPHYPQSNGKAENAVKTCKMLMKKALEGKQDFFLSLLDFRNTPSGEIGLSPAQRMFGRRTRSLLPALPVKFEPSNFTQIKEKVEIAREKQKKYYDRGSKELPAIQEGATIRMKLPGSQKWSKGVCVRKRSSRSYVVNVNDTLYTRNRRQLITTTEVAEKQPEMTTVENKITPRRSNRENRRPPDRYTN